MALAQGVRPGHALLTAEVSPGRPTPCSSSCSAAGWPPEDIALARLDEIGPIAPGAPAPSLIWADVLGQATRNARPVARYLVFMVIGGRDRGASASSTRTRS